MVIKMKELIKIQQIMCEIIDIFEKYEIPTDIACNILLNTIKIINICEKGERLCKK